MALKVLDVFDTHTALVPAGTSVGNGNLLQRDPARQHPGRRLFWATVWICASSTALLLSTALASTDTTLPIVTLSDSPPALALVNTAAKLLAESNSPVNLVLSQSQEQYRDTPDLPLQARLLTPTRFVLERLDSDGDTPVHRVILGRLHLPENQSASEQDSLTLLSIADGRLPPGISRFETLLLTTAAWRLAGNPQIYRQLLAALERAVVIENAAFVQRGDATQAPFTDGISNPAQPFLYRLSLDWSLMTSLQLRLAWVRELHPEFRDREVDILSWIAPLPLTDVSPGSVDHMLLDSGATAQ